MIITKLCLWLALGMGMYHAFHNDYAHATYWVINAVLYQLWIDEAARK
jgi:hypothetical protein